MRRTQVGVLVLGLAASALFVGKAALALYLPVLTMGVVFLLERGWNRRQRLALVVGLIGIALATAAAYVWSFDVAVRGGDKVYCPSLPKLLGPPAAAVMATIVAVLALKDPPSCE